MTINVRKIRLQLDTTSDITLISRKTWEKLASPAERPSKHIARNASGNDLKLQNELELDCET